jgi:predicted PhzF superfamily epimerase YddE/YHI9
MSNILNMYQVDVFSEQRVTDNPAAVLISELCLISLMMKKLPAKRICLNARLPVHKPLAVALSRFTPAHQINHQVTRMPR